MHASDEGIHDENYKNEPQCHNINSSPYVLLCNFTTQAWNAGASPKTV